MHDWEGGRCLPTNEDGEAAVVPHEIACTVGFVQCFLFRLCFPCQAFREPWPASALLASSSSASLTCPWALGGPVLRPRLCQQPCWLLRCILIPAEADCLSLFRVPFGLGLARSLWVPWARFSQYGAHQAALELRDITFVEEGRERNTSVALGCSPSSSLSFVRHACVGTAEATETGALALLGTLEGLLLPLARALCGIVFLALCKLLTRGMCWRATPLGKLLCYVAGCQCAVLERLARPERKTWAATARLPTPFLGIARLDTSCPACV